MKTNTAKRIDTLERPLVLRIIVVLMALFGVVAIGVGLWGILFGIGFGANTLGLLVVLVALVAFVPGILELVVARGLWNLKLWAWVVAVVGHSVGGVWLLLATASTDIMRVQSLMALALLVPVACLLMPRVMRVFWRQ